MKGAGMTRAAAAVMAAVLSAAGAGRAQTPVPQAVFRTNTDLVTVPVFVKGSDSKIGALHGGDFILTDNGVPQKVETVDSESIPVDVTVLMETGRAIDDYRKHLNEQVQRIAALMRPTDRIEVLGIDTYVNVLVPFGPPTRELAVARFAGGGVLSVNDALTSALLRQPSPDRRHLIIAMTDSVDTMSALTMASVREIARRSSATLVVSWITMSQDDSVVKMRGQPLPRPTWMTTSEKVERYAKDIVKRDPQKPQPWAAHYEPRKGRFWEDFDALRDAAKLTGGSLHPPGVFVDRDAAEIFDKIYAEFRQNYILRYLPTGVTRDGWHDVKVTIPKSPGTEVRARRGYLIEPVTDKAAPAAAEPTLFEAFSAGAAATDLVAMHAALASADTPERLSALMKDFESAGDLFPDNPRREFVAALVLAETALASTSDSARADAVKMLIRYRSLVRPPLGPDDFAREWSASGGALLDAAAQPGGLTDRPLLDAHLDKLAELIRSAK